MQGVTRGATTLFGVIVAGFLIWWGASALPGEGDATIGEFWWAAGLTAAAGLTMALSQLLGGWTKWGWPRISRSVFLLGFLPALIAGGWVVIAAEPGDHWLGSHVRGWSEDIGLESLVGDLMKAWPALAFGVGLTFGLTFDTTGPRTEPASAPGRQPIEEDAGQPDLDARNHEPDDPRVPTGEGETPQPEGQPPPGEPRREE
jgi:hypothetical protein